MEWDDTPWGLVSAESCSGCIHQLKFRINRLDVSPVVRSFILSPQADLVQTPLASFAVKNRIVDSVLAIGFLNRTANFGCSESQSQP
jgi:hypothetical protein